jgi:hypothetical protein
MKLCECYKLNELKDKYPNDMEFGREARKLTIDGSLGKLIQETPLNLKQKMESTKPTLNESESGNKSKPLLANRNYPDRCPNCDADGDDLQPYDNENYTCEDCGIVLNYVCNDLELGKKLREEKI